MASRFLRRASVYRFNDLPVYRFIGYRFTSLSTYVHLLCCIGRNSADSSDIPRASQTTLQNRQEFFGTLGPPEKPKDLIGPQGFLGKPAKTFVFLAMIKTSSGAMQNPEVF